MHLFLSSFLKFQHNIVFIHFSNHPQRNLILGRKQDASPWAKVCDEASKVSPAARKRHFATANDEPSKRKLGASRSLCLLSKLISAEREANKKQRQSQSLQPSLI
jgi:hypothetical protein